MGCSPSVPQTTAKAVALPPVTKRPAYYDDDWAKLPKDAPDGQRIQSAMSGLTLVEEDLHDAATKGAKRKMVAETVIRTAQMAVSFVPPPYDAAAQVVLNIVLAAAKPYVYEKACLQLAQKTASLLRIIMENSRNDLSGGAFTRGPTQGPWQQCVDRFKKVAESQAEIMKAYNERPLLGKAIFGSEAIRQMEELDEQLNDIVRCFKLNLQMEVHAGVEFLSHVKLVETENDKKLRELVEKVRGKRTGDLSEEDIKQVFDALSGEGQALMDQMQRGEAALGAKLEDLKDAHERGPWQIIKHGKLQALWRMHLGKNIVKADAFWTAFPEELEDHDEKDKERLIALFADGGTGSEKNRRLFQAVVDVNKDGKLTCREIHRAFPEERDIVESVEEILKSDKAHTCLELGDMEGAGHYGTVFTVPYPTPLFRGREDQLQDLANLLNDQQRVKRLVIVHGPAGQGKAELACAAAKRALTSRWVAGGAYCIKMQYVTNEDSLLHSLVDVLAPMERTGIDSGCISQMLNSQLARLAQLNAQVLLVLPHADMLFADEEAAKAVNGRLISMLAAVPLMKIVLTMTRHADAVAPVFGGREFILVDSGLSPTDGAELLAAMVAPLKGRYADLQALAASVEGVPHRLSQLGVQLCNEKEPGARLSELLAHSEETDALKEEKYTVIVKQHLHKLAESDVQLCKALVRWSMFPSNFDAKGARLVLGLDTNNQFTKIIRVLLSRKLCVKEDMQDKLYKLDPKMRLGCCALDAADLVQLGMEGDALQQAATCYVDYCHKMLVSARDSVIETYVVNPVAAFASARANKLDIEHVLLHIPHAFDCLDRSVATSSATCLDQLCDIMRMLPYISAYSTANIAAAAHRILAPAFKFQSHVDLKAAALLALIACEPIEDAAAMKGMYTELRGLLHDLEGAEKERRTQMLVLACRLTGNYFREKFELDESFDMLKEGQKLLDASGFKGKSTWAKMEEVLLMTELAGTLDYYGATRQAEGKAAAEQALELVDNVLLEGVVETSHPIRALAMTYLGFFYKAEDRHEDVITVNEKAMDIRAEVYGGDHPEIAQNLNQMAISLVALARLEPRIMQQAEEKYIAAKELRERALGRDHVLVANTLRNMGDMYAAMGTGQEAKAAECYQRACNVFMGKNTPKKALPCLEPLPGLYRACGKESEAQKADEMLKSLKP